MPDDRPPLADPLPVAAPSAAATAGPRWLHRWPEALLGLLLGTVGFGQAMQTWALGETDAAEQLLVASGMTAAAVLYRTMPSLALALVWGVGLLQIWTGLDLMPVEVAVVVVAYGAARYGSVATLWLSALSVPVAYLVGALYLVEYGRGLATDLGLTSQSLPVRPEVLLVAGASAPLAIPWLIGLVLRMGDRNRTNRQRRVLAERSRERAEAGREQAEELARLRASQARMARDVHDVVGHSLAVILAQAGSAQYLPDDDPAHLKQTLDNIANAARESLGEVRDVLSATGDHASVPPPGGLDSLIDGVRSSARVSDEVVGTPGELPPETATVAYRVLQEMLTNALKHGRAGEPVVVLRDWSRGLRVEVRNTVGAETTDHGRGVDGMHRRLATVGGALTTSRQGDLYVAQAWLPVAGPGDSPPTLMLPPVPGGPVPGGPGG